MPNNMNLKLITLTAVTALSLGGAALAQDQETDGQQRPGGHGGRHRGDMIEHMTESLNLTPEQKTKVQPILDDAKSKMQAIRRDAMEKSKAAMEDMKTKIRPMLTPEQQKQLDEMKNNRRGGHKGRHGHGGSGGDDEGDNG